MAGKAKRALIVGASGSLGKELAEWLAGSSTAEWDISLADAGEGGEITAVGEEALVVAPLESMSYAGADIVFFAGDAASTRAGWKDAVAAGAALVDLTGVLETEAGATLYAPGFEAGKPDLSTVAMAPVLPAAWLLAAAVTATKAQRGVGTVLLPASQFGDAAIDELHQQTVAMLSFANQPRAVFDVQVAYAVRDEFGAEAQHQLSAETRRVTQQLQALTGTADRVAFSLIHAPVFHGTAASLWLEFAEDVSQGTLKKSLSGDGFAMNVVDDDVDVSNQSAIGEDEALVRIRLSGSRTAWLWVALDNVRWLVRAAESCALELLAMRPDGKVQ